MRRFASIAAAALFAGLAIGSGASLAGSPSQAVVFNGTRLTAAVERAVDVMVRGRLPGGAYWYDRRSGAWGRVGGPIAGFILPGLRLGGPLRANASGSRLPWFVNGRALHPLDLLGLVRLLGVPIPRGRYWLDSHGNFGIVGNSVPVVNLIRLAYARSAPRPQPAPDPASDPATPPVDDSQGGGGGGAYQQQTYGGYVGSDGDTSYFFDPSTGCSVVSGGGVSC